MSISCLSAAGYVNANVWCPCSMPASCCHHVGFRKLPAAGLPAAACQLGAAVDRQPTQLTQLLAPAWPDGANPSAPTPVKPYQALRTYQAKPTAQPSPAQPSPARLDAIDGPSFHLLIKSHRQGAPQNGTGLSRWPLQMVARAIMTLLQASHPTFCPSRATTPLAQRSSQTSLLVRVDVHDDYAERR